MPYDPDPKLGATPFRLVNAGTADDATVALAAPGRLLAVNGLNINAAAVHVKFYNKATAPDVSTDVPVWGFSIGGGTAGISANPQIPPEGIYFSAGISYVIVSGAANTNSTDVTAANVTVNGAYKASS